MIKFLVLSVLCWFFVQDDPTISWDSKRKVNWTDFKAEPRPHDNVVAVTASGISFQYSTTKFSGGRIEYDFDIKAHFYPEKSWYLKAKVTDVTLAHERLHFDITELHARLFRREVQNFNFSQNVNAEMDAINSSINEDLREMQRTYDTETKHSQDEDKQLLWQNYISKMLDEMKQYQK
jgi:hypothetical protein